MNIIQLDFNLFFAFLGAYLSVLLAMILKQNGRVLEKIEEGFKSMDERAEQRHMEVIELLKKGFGDLSKDIRELKAG